MQYAFPKHNKLCGRLAIDNLYATGKRFVAWPLRVTWKLAEETKVLVWAPKSLFKHAVDRNHLRRLMREAYRLNQGILANPQSSIPNPHFLIAFNYMDKEQKSFAEIEKAMRKALKKIADAR